MKKLLIFIVSLLFLNFVNSMETTENLYGGERPVVVIHHIINNTALGFKLKAKSGTEISIPAFARRQVAINIPLKSTNENDLMDQGIIRFLNPMKPDVYYEIRFSRKIKKLPTNEYQLAVLGRNC